LRILRAIIEGIRAELPPHEEGEEISIGGEWDGHWVLGVLALLEKRWNGALLQSLNQQ